MMGINDKQGQFDQIVAQLTTQYPSLAGRPRRSRGVIVALCVLGALVWGLLSVAMVAWGAAGVVLACSMVVLAGIAIAVDSHRYHRR